MKSASLMTGLSQSVASWRMAAIARAAQTASQMAMASMIASLYLDQTVAPMTLGKWPCRKPSAPSKKTPPADHRMTRRLPTTKLNRLLIRNLYCAYSGPDFAQGDRHWQCCNPVSYWRPLRRGDRKLLPGERSDWGNERALQTLGPWAELSADVRFSHMFGPQRLSRDRTKGG